MKKRGFKILAGSIVLNVVLWILVLTTFPKNDPLAILHYTAGVGVDFVGNGQQVLVLPGIGLALLCLNVILAYTVRQASVIAAWIFLASVPIIEVMLIVTYIMLLRLNS